MRRRNLSRAIVELGIYPAVDPLASTSRILDPRIIGDEHYKRRARREAGAPALQGPAGHHRDPRHRRVVGRRQADGRARAEDPALPVAAVLRRGAVHRLPGKYVPIAETVRSFKELVEGKHDAIPEQAFYMVGTIEEALAKAEKMAKAYTWRSPQASTCTS